MLRISMLTAACVTCLAAPALAQEAPEDWFAAAEGRWTAEGRSFGMASQSEMVWETALGGAFRHLSYRIVMTPETGDQRVFEGVGYYRMRENSVSAYWADSTGDLHPIRANVADGALTAHWGVAGAKQGRTEYRFTGPDTLQVTDWLLTPEGWRQFNQGEFTRE